MKKFLLIITLLSAVLACNFNVSTVTPAAGDTMATPTVDLTQVPMEIPIGSTPAPEFGIITGKLSYPSEFIPQMRISFFSLIDGKAYYIDTDVNQSTYLIYVPVGTYYVVAYPYAGVPGTVGSVESFTPFASKFAGGYTQMVPCGLSVDCTDHSLIPVVVEANQTTTADPGDWYAPEASFPEMPNPNP